MPDSAHRRAHRIVFFSLMTTEVIHLCSVPRRHISNRLVRSVNRVTSFCFRRNVRGGSRLEPTSGCRKQHPLACAHRPERRRHFGLEKVCQKRQPTSSAIRGLNSLRQHSRTDRSRTSGGAGGPPETMTSAPAHECEGNRMNRRHS